METHLSIEEMKKKIDFLANENAELKYENEKRKSWCEFLESASTAKFREIIERADAIESNTTLDRCSEASHYTWLDDQITKITRQRDALKKALESVSISSEKDEFLSDVEYRHRISMIHLACTKALQDVEESENE